MEARDHVLGAQNVTVNDREMFLAVAIVPEGDDELAKTRRQIGNRLDLHADVMSAKALAIVLHVALDEVIEVRNGRKAG